MLSEVEMQDVDVQDAEAVTPLQAMKEVFAVLANETRLRILQHLGDGEQSVNALVTLTGSSQSQISHQLQMLRYRRLVKWERRGNQIFYRIASENVGAMLESAKGLLN